MLLGGGKLLFNMALKLKQKNIPVIVVSSPRHIEEKLEDNISLKELFIRNNIETIVTENIGKDQNVINHITPNTMGISIGAAWILRKQFIEKFNGRLVNVHGARLPQNRGGGNFSWQILNNNRLGVCLIHLLDEGIDTGLILKYDEFFYPNSCRTPNDYINLYTEKNIKFLIEFISELEKQKEFVEINQPEYFSTYWPRISSEHNGFIDWNWSLQQIESFICAFDDPYAGATTFINDTQVFLKNCIIDKNDGMFHPFQKGIVYKKSNNSLFIATEHGTLIVGTVLDINNDNIYDNIQFGDRFYTPVSLIDKAKQYRAFYTSKGLK
jgi:methionyl-tRNA formyltransferase